MTDEEYQAALVVQKNAIKAYITNADSVKRALTSQIILSTVINNAGNPNPMDVLTTLTALHNALDTAMSSP